MSRFLTFRGNIMLLHPNFAASIEIVLMMLSFVTGLVRGLVILLKTVFISTAETLSRLDMPVGNPFNAYRDSVALAPLLSPDRGAVRYLSFCSAVLADHVRNHPVMRCAVSCLLQTVRWGCGCAVVADPLAGVRIDRVV